MHIRIENLFHHFLPLRIAQTARAFHPTHPQPPSEACFTGFSHDGTQSHAVPDRRPYRPLQNNARTAGLYGHTDRLLPPGALPGALLSPAARHPKGSPSQTAEQFPGAPYTPVNKNRSVAVARTWQRPPPSLWADRFPGRNVPRPLIPCNLCPAARPATPLTSTVQEYSHESHV